MELTFKKESFSHRLTTMLKVDFKKMFTSSPFYIMTFISLMVPILVIIMTSMVGGNVTIDPNTGEETIMESFKNVYQAIGSLSNASMSMDITSMCNINMVYFIVAIFVCLFVASEFRSGYVKNLFTYRAKKDDYIVSKTIVCFIAGVIMLLIYFIGSIIAGKIMGLSFEMEGFNTFNLIMCIIAKVGLCSIFVALPLLASVIAKEKTWLSISLSLGMGMLLFMMIPMLTPLNSSLMNAFMCLIGGAIFATGIGAISTLVLKNKSIL